MQHGKDIEQYSSRVEEITKNYMVIAMPMSKGYPIFLQAGEPFFGKIMLNSSAYRFKSNFLDKKMHPIPIWKIAIPYDIEKVQMREFVRIEAMLPVSIQFMPIEENSQPIHMLTKDISGGGTQIVSKQSIIIGSKLQLNIDIPDFGMITVSGEVVREDRPQADNALYWIGLKFLDIQEKDRNKIIKYIFKKELEKRRKEI